MASSLSPTARTLAALRAEGYPAWVVEKFNAFAGPHGKRSDLFNIIDVLALDFSRGVVGVQCCASSGLAAHREKLLVEHAQDTINWLSTPGTRLEIWGWRQIKVKVGGKAMRWSPRVEAITLADLGIAA